MKWITRERVKVDRVACPWLIQNFVDRNAEFVFLPHDTDWSAISDGIVYDVPNCELGHHGEDVSFNSILKKYQLTDPALLLLSEIVRTADDYAISQFPVTGCERLGDILNFGLTTKHTDCLAKEKCGVPDNCSVAQSAAVGCC